MVDVAELRAAMARKEMTQKKLASMMGLSEQAFSRRMQRKDFGTSEAKKISDILGIENPVAIFFASK